MGCPKNSCGVGWHSLRGPPPQVLPALEAELPQVLPSPVCGSEPWLLLLWTRQGASARQGATHWALQIPVLLGLVEKLPLLRLLRCSPTRPGVKKQGSVSAKPL